MTGRFYQEAVREKKTLDKWAGAEVEDTQLWA